MNAPRIIILISVLAVLFSCATNKEVQDVNSRVDALERTIVASIDQQVASITNSISGLQSTDKELKSYLAALQSVSDELSRSLEANEKEVSSLEEKLTNEINAANLEQLEAMKALSEKLHIKLENINAILTDLKDRDEALENKVTSLQEYVNSELKKSKDWVSATFTTIEQYNSTVEAIAGIKADIESINKELEALGARIQEEIDSLSKKLAGLDEKIEGISVKFGEELSNTVKSLNEKIEAQSETINATISSTSDGLKKWVNEQLTAYYTIAQIDAKITNLETCIKDGDDALTREIDALKAQVSQQKSDITTAYKKAVSDAISSNNGIIEGKIQTAVTEVNNRITSELEDITQELESINSRLNGIEKSIADILKMVQSIVAIPTYSDGSVALGEGETCLYFEVFPIEVAQSLETVALSSFSLKAISTIQTKADVEYKELPVTAVKYVDGLFEVTTTGKDIDEGFFNGQTALNARLALTDGLNSLSTSYFSLKPQGDVSIIGLRIAEYKNKIIDRIILDGGGDFIIRFVDGSSIELDQNSIAPRLYFDYDGYWSVSFDNGENSSRLMNNNAEFIRDLNVHAESILSVRFVEGDSGRYAYQTYYSSDPETVIDVIETPQLIDTKNTIQSIVEDRVHNTVTIKLAGGESFTFRKVRVVPTGVSVLTNKIKLAKGVTTPVEFRVNPSNAIFDYDVTSSGCEVSLDYVGDATKSGYITAPTNYILSGIEPVYDAVGTKKEGQYRAYITDIGASTNYDNLVALVLTINDGIGQTVQLSSSAVEAKYSGNLITKFRFLKSDNSGALEDVEATIDGANITINTPFIFDKTNLVASFETNGSKVFADNNEQTSGITAVDFTAPVKYTVLSADGEKNDYMVTVNISGLPVVYINTKGGVSIDSKTEWLKKTYIKIVNEDGTVDYEDNSLQIRGRGNSTWTYPKKPYALKLNSKHPVLGMPQHKRWVLLANWMDRTLLRNDVAFQIAKQTSLAWTPRGQFVEVVLNGVHKGNYYLCEQIKIDANRVNIAELEETDIAGDEVTGGYLMELDVLYDEVNKFKSTIKNLPYMFKEPDEDALQPEQFNYFQSFINELEAKMYDDNWLSSREYASYMDLETFADWWFVYELTRNWEPNHPKSSYIYKDRLGRLVAGPVWDFDYGTFRPGGGFTIINALYYNRLFQDPDFVLIVKSRWSLLKPLFDQISDYIYDKAVSTKNSNHFNIRLWPISSSVNGDESLSFDASISRMISAYEEKLEWLDAAITDL